MAKKSRGRRREEPRNGRESQIRAATREDQARVGNEIERDVETHKGTRDMAHAGGEFRVTRPTNWKEYRRKGTSTVHSREGKLPFARQAGKEEGRREQ